MQSALFCIRISTAEFLFDSFEFSYETELQIELDWTFEFLSVELLSQNQMATLAKLIIILSR